jgi:SAM-dependent methyltransferase
MSLLTAPPEAAPTTADLEASRLRRYDLFDRHNRPYFQWQVDQFRPYLGRRILEVGCGVGSILNLLGERDLLFGIDVEPDVLARARERFHDRPECRFALIDLTAAAPDDWSLLRQQRFDSVVCINVLEHIRDDVGALQKMEELLEPGGTLALLVPAHLALYGPYDRLDGHYRRYSKAYLRTILSHTGFELLRCRYFNAIGAVGWWVQYKLLRRTVHGEGQLGLMNRLLPVVRPLEKVLPVPFGLSLVAVCRKRPVPGVCHAFAAP